MKFTGGGAGGVRMDGEQGASEGSPAHLPGGQECPPSVRMVGEENRPAAAPAVHQGGPQGCSQGVIYLMRVGKVGDLRDSLQILTEGVPDDQDVFKWGKSCNYQEQIVEHSRGLTRLRGALLSLTYLAHVDKEHLSEAETSIKQYLFSIGVHLSVGNKVDGHSELVALTPSHVKAARQAFKATAQECGTEVQSELGKLQRDVQVEQVARQMAEVQLASKTNELETERAFHAQRMDSKTSELDTERAFHAQLLVSKDELLAVKDEKQQVMEKYIMLLERMTRPVS